MAYEPKPGKGAIFKNTHKNADNHPDYRGYILTPKGEKYDLSLWLSEAKDGTKYFSVSAQEPYNKPEKGGEPAPAAPIHDDLPF